MRMWNQVFLLVLFFAPSVLWGDIAIGGGMPFPGTDKKDVVSHRVSSETNSFLTPVSFPKTVDDISFTDKVALVSDAYQPFKDVSSYRELIVESEEDFINRQMALAHAEIESDYETMDIEEYCKEHPLDEEHCPQEPGTLTKVIGFGDDDKSDRNNAEYSGPTIGGGVVVAKNSTVGGSCYPAAKYSKFKNEILTTGRYETISPAFEKAMITLFRKEGTCGKIKGDPCGYTCYGIGENCLGKHIGVDVRTLTRPKAEDIYYKHYWKKYNLEMLPDVISGDVFLAMMGSGSGTGIKQLRKFLGLNTGTNKIDESVVSAIANYQGDIHNHWLDMRQQFLIKVAEAKYDNQVLEGWMRGIKLKRKNGCHVIPEEPLYRR